MLKKIQANKLSLTNCKYAIQSIVLFTYRFFEDNTTVTFNLTTDEESKHTKSADHEESLENVVQSNERREKKEKVVKFWGLEIFLLHCENASIQTENVQDAMPDNALKHKNVLYSCIFEISAPAQILRLAIDMKIHKSLGIPIFIR